MQLRTGLSALPLQAKFQRRAVGRGSARPRVSGGLWGPSAEAMKGAGVRDVGPPTRSQKPGLLTVPPLRSGKAALHQARAAGCQPFWELGACQGVQQIDYWSKPIKSRRCSLNCVDLRQCQQMLTTITRRQCRQCRTPPPLRGAAGTVFEYREDVGAEGC